MSFYDWLRAVEEKADQVVDSHRAARLFHSGASVMDAVVELCK